MLIWYIVLSCAVVFCSVILNQKVKEQLDDRLIKLFDFAITANLIVGIIMYLYGDNVIMTGHNEILYDSWSGHRIDQRALLAFLMKIEGIMAIVSSTIHGVVFSLKKNGLLMEISTEE